MNVDMEFPPFEECPVILSEQEYKSFEHMTKKRSLCIHNWVLRKGRPKDEFMVVGDDKITTHDLPDGRYCPKCLNVRFMPLKGDAEIWTQKDMMALGFK